MFRQAQVQKFVVAPTVTPHEERSLTGHTERVYALTVLPDGRLVSGSEDATIRIWDVGLRPASIVVSKEISNLQETKAATISERDTNEFEN